MAFEIPDQPHGRYARETQKHPLFDQYWEKYSRMVFWWAFKLSRSFNDGDHRFYDDYIGQLTLRMNRALWGYDESKINPKTGKPFKFSTYYGCRIWSEVKAFILRYESESRALAWFNQHATFDEVSEQQMSFATYESDFRLYRPPCHDDTWANEIINCFGSRQELWDWITRPLRKRDKFIVYARFKYALSLEDIGQRLKVSKERVRQLEVKAKEAIRHRIQSLEPFLRLFTLPQPTTSAHYTHISGHDEVKLFNSPLQLDGVFAEIEKEIGGTPDLDTKTLKTIAKGKKTREKKEKEIEVRRPSFYC